ncbi:MAG: AAA family ATPase [Rikenellaceae bacterium]
MLSTHITSQIYTKICFETTVDQKKIIEMLSNYICDDNFSSIFILNGYAGTGKTTVIAAVVATLNELNIKTILLAPTGRAANVLGRVAKKEAHTIHKKIYREKSRTDYDSKFSLNYNRESDVIFLVDEASMLSESNGQEAIFGSGSLLDDLVSYVRSGKRCKLILVGDNAQLPPVGQEFSPALDPNTMSHFGEVIYGTMDEVVRQGSQSGILFNATMVRCMIENDICEIPLFEMNYPDVEALEGGEFTEKLQECYDKFGRDETIVITRSNKRANRYNEGIRRFSLGAEEEIESGDMLMIVRNNYYFSEREESAPMSFIANGDIAELRRLRRFEEFYGFRFAEATLSFGDYDGYDITCKVLLDTLSSDSPALSYEDNKRLFYEVEKDYAEIKNKANRYKEIRENPHFNALQVKFAYAVTCHKAQGGQWRSVFIDRCLFGDEQMSRDMLRWLYTAITRATERLYFVNFDERFFVS